MSRPKSRSGLLGMGRRSSSGSVTKIDLNESAQDKARFKINTKADPTKAIMEVQPSQLQAVGETTISPLRTLEHKDYDGNLITDPDRSNPTRPRLERPLDTIRSFEAAIDGSYNRRQSLRPESTAPTPYQNRRSGYFNGYHQPQRPPTDGGYHGGGSYYNNRHSMIQSRADGYSEYGAPPNQHNQGGRRFAPRNYSDPALYGRQAESNVYQSHGHHQSYDTVGTASNGSHMTDQWGNSTNPSSENSSVDKFQAPPPPPKADLGESYGFSGFGVGPQFQGPILEEYGHDTPAYGENGYGRPQNGATGPGLAQHYNEQPPQVPAHRAPVPPPKQTSANDYARQTRGGYDSQSNQARPPMDKAEKRKSWLKRTFSKN